LCKRRQSSPIAPCHGFGGAKDPRTGSIPGWAGFAAPNLKLEVEDEIRKVYLDLEAATSEVEVAQKNVQVVKETLDLTRRRVEAGVAESVELVQSQEALAGAELDYINSVFAHNVAKLSLARYMGHAAENLPQFLSLQ